MFSTLEGAKKFAKNLKTLFDDSGIIFPLNRCQKPPRSQADFEIGTTSADRWQGRIDPSILAHFAGG